MNTCWQEEFQEYWHWNSLNTRMREDWFERMAHPQVNCEAFWYHPESGITTYDCPATSSVQVTPADLTLDIPREGPVWNFTAFELKSILREGHGEDFGLAAEALAQRACYEFETWLPRVLSWHDYQYRCFWFFGGKDTGKDSKESKSFFGSDAEACAHVGVDFAGSSVSASITIHEFHSSTCGQRALYTPCGLSAGKSPVVCRRRLF